MRLAIAVTAASAVLVYLGMARMAQAQQPCRPLPKAYLYSADPFECPGVDNLYRVDGNLYRSGQPDSRGFTSLADGLGIRTVVNLQDELDDTHFLLPDRVRMDFVQVPISSYNITADGGRKLMSALAAIDRGLKRGPVLVHCSRGSDRTGTVIALYRIRYQGWSAEDAIREMKQGPYDFNHMYALFGDVVDFVRAYGSRSP